MKSKRGWFLWVILGVLSAVLVSLRLRWIPHLLAWDEAMNLCTVRSLVSGGDDSFASWFWRHPPLFCVMMAGLGPFTAGFAARAEILAVSLNMLTMGVLFLLNRRIFGIRVALWSALFFAVLPGNVFFSVWIKRDHGVALFGLLGLLLQFNKKYLFAGLCMGLAMLFKETAIFYIMAGGLLWVAEDSAVRRARDVLLWCLSALLVSGWWFLFFENIGEHLSFGAGSQVGWRMDADYYFMRIIDDLGYPGIAILLLGGIISLVTAGRGEKNRDVEKGMLRTVWPVYLLVPSYILLSALRGKVPWVVMSLYAGWSTMLALAANSITAAMLSWKKAENERIRNLVSGSFMGLVLTVMIVNVWFRGYEDVLRSTEEGQWRGASYSRELADIVNSNVNDNERMLVTSFHYWKGLAPGVPCAVFACYLDVDCEILLRAHDSDFSSLWKDVVESEIDWALLSPEPGLNEIDIFGGFDAATSSYPLKGERGWLIRIEERERAYSSASGNLR